MGPASGAHYLGGMASPDRILAAAGLAVEGKRLADYQQAANAAYEAGRYDEGDYYAEKADVLEEVVESTLMAYEEEGDGQGSEPPVQSVVRCMADVWHEYMTPDGNMTNDSSRREVMDYMRDGYGDPQIVYALRRIVGDEKADGMLLLAAAEDAYHAHHATRGRIRAGAAKRRASGVDPLKEAQRFARRARRRMTKKKVLKNRRTSRRRTSRR